MDNGQGFDLSDKLTEIGGQYGFTAGQSGHADRLATIKSVWQSDKELIDPHTADGIHTARRLRRDGETIVCLETALAAKFEDTVCEAVGKTDIPRPAALADLESRPQRVQNVPNDAGAVKRIIQAA